MQKTVKENIPGKSPQAFVTYARIDSEYRHQLVNSLQKKNIVPTGDWELVPGPDFFPQLENKILKADVYIYLISHASLSSEICQVELQYAEKLGKKILPVRIDFSPLTAITPAALVNPQWVFEKDMDKTATQIQIAIYTNFALLDQHTNLTIAAEAWHQQSGPLLKGTSLKAATAFQEEMLMNRLPYPVFTTIMESYVKASKKAAFARLLTAISVGITLSLLLIILIQQLNLKKLERNKSKREQSYKLAFASQNAFKDNPGAIMQSLLLGKEAMQVNPSVEADIALRQALRLTPKIIANLYTGGEMKQTAFSPDGKHFAALTSSDSFFVWNTASWAENNFFSRQAAVATFIFTDHFLFTIGSDSMMTVFDLSGQYRKDSQKVKFDVDYLMLCQAADQIAVASVYFTETELVIYNALTLKATSFIAPGGLRSFALSNDSKYLVTASDDKTVRLWFTNGTQKIKIDALNSPEWVAFDTKAEHFFAFDGKLHRWQLSGNDRGYQSKDIFEKVATKGSISASAFTLGPKGDIGVSISNDRLGVYEMQSGVIGNNRWSIPIEKFRNSRQVLFSNDDAVFASWSDDNVIRIWDSKRGMETARFTYDGQVIRTEALTYDPIKSVSLSSDGRYIAIALQSRDSLSDRNNPLYILEARGYTSSLLFEDEDESRGLSFGYKGKNCFMASGGGDQGAIVRVGNVDTGDTVVLRTGKDSRIWSTCFSPNSQYLAFADRSGTLWVWDWLHNKALFRDDGIGDINKICFSGDVKYLAATGFHTGVTLWDIISKKLLTSFGHYDSIENFGVNDIAFSPVEKLLATASDDSTACVWTVPGGKKVATLPHKGWVKDIDFDSSGKYIATACWDNTAALWETKTRKKLFTLPHDKQVNKTVFSPDGKYLATASGDCCGIKGGDMTEGKITIWKISDGTKVQEIIHPLTVWDICYSPDGKYIASSSADNILRIWEAGSGSEISRIILQFGTPFPIEIKFSPDGKYIAAPGEVYLWRAEDLIKEADARKTRELSPVEKKQYLSN